MYGLVVRTLAFWPWEPALTLTMVNLPRRWLLDHLWGDNHGMWYRQKVLENYTMCWPKSWLWNWVDKTVWNLSIVVLASTKSEVIWTEGLSILALFKLVITPDYTFFSLETVTKVCSAELQYKSQDGFAVIEQTEMCMRKYL